MIEVDALAVMSQIRHGFFTREGGVSEGVYGSLNCGFGSNDSREAVAENRARAARRLGASPDALVTGYQVHSPDVATVTTPWTAESSPKVDGLVTNRSGVLLGVLAADCTPVLFADPHAGVIGSAHSGWPGTRAGVLEATVKAMTALGARPERITAAIGPAIGPDSYEVGPEFPARFTDSDPEAADFFRPAERAGHFMFDLPGYVALRLRRLGLGMVVPTVADTYAEPERFFSYRRTCHLGEKDYGRGLSAIMLA
jgi:YfiH family protein